MRMPPKGFTPRFSGSSVCRPTMSSSSLERYPGAKVKRLITVSVSTFKTPPFSRSAAIRASSFAIRCLVRAVGPARNLPSPVYGL